MARERPLLKIWRSSLSSAYLNMSHKVYYVYDLISSMRIPRFDLHFHEEGGGDDDEHGEGVLGQGGGAGSRWGEELEKGDFFLSNSSSS